MNVSRGSVDMGASSEATIRLKLPWHVILAACGALGVAVITMWSSVGKLTEQVGELKNAVQLSNTLVIALQRDVDAVKWRMDSALERVSALERMLQRTK